MTKKQKKQKEINRIERWECPHLLTYIDPYPSEDGIIRCSKCGKPHYINPKKSGSES